MLTKSLIFLVCFLAYASCQTYTALNYSDCGMTSNSNENDFISMLYFILGSIGVKINRLTYSPVPVLHPAPGKIVASIAATEKISGVIKAEVKIVRTVNKIKLPVGCYVHEGVQYGSCYDVFFKI